MRRYVVATSGLGVTNRDLRRTANSLVDSTERPRNWIVVDSTAAQEKVTRMRRLRTSTVVVARDELPIPEDAWIVFLRAGDALVVFGLEEIQHGGRMTPRPGQVGAVLRLQERDQEFERGQRIRVQLD